MQKVCSEWTWSQAYKICGPQRLENEDDILKTENIPDEQDFRIGIAVYSVVTEWFEEIAFREQIFDSTNPGNCATLCCGYCQKHRIQTHKWEGRCCGTKNDSIDGKCGTEKETASFSIKSTSAFPTELFTLDTDTSGIYIVIVIVIMDYNVVFDTFIGHQPDNKEKRTNWISQNGTFIGGIISGVSVLTVVITLTVCKFRSGGPFKSRDTNKNQSDIFPNKLEEGKTTKTLLNQAHSSDKFQMENISERAGTGDADVDNIFTDSPNGEYDVLNDSQRRKIRVQENVYDSNATMINQDDHMYDQSVFRKLAHEGDGDVNDYSLARTEKKWGL
ncbi:unnamed protein product [Mytilus edulis]|uniref:Uncharacterized protein n=1 Tax=Mytilus edulis TaxID=6550 RepID=A0A8S3S085_MYTED|nr:unnamed protein product [Mytilus edulis]